MQLIIVGAGVLGVHHALAALDAGWKVHVVERDPRPRSASVRNFGLVWCSGRRPGPELELALDARDRWEQVGRRFPEIGFRPAGSITLARRVDEVDVLEEFREHAAERRLDVELLTAAGVPSHNPALAGDALAGLLVRDDAVVEPRRTAPSLLDRIEAHPSACVHRRAEAVEVAGGTAGVQVTVRSLVDGTTELLRADAVVLCPGAQPSGIAAQLLADQPVDRCQLQMFETNAVAIASRTAFADGDSLRYYPGFAELPSARDLAPAEPLVDAERLQLLVAPRQDGGLTVGDSHRYDEPFPFDLDERITDHLLERLGRALGRRSPRIRRRWSGVYARYLGDGPYLHLTPQQGVHLITGVAGMGMTVSPAVAARTLEVLG